MTDLTPEVMNALVRLMNGEVDYAEIDNDGLIALGSAAKSSRETLYRVTVLLNERGLTFSQIGEKLGVHEATASRWAKPPKKRDNESADVDEIATAEADES